MAKNLNYVAYKDLQQIKINKNILLNLKINLILKHCLQKISYDTQTHTKPTNHITQIAKQLIENENLNFQTQTDIIELLHDKIECMRLLIEENYMLQFDHLLKYIEKLLRIQNLLIKQYEAFPCERTQCVLGFFYSELLNDYQASNQLFSVLTISDEKMKKIALNQDVFNSKMIYLITEFKGKMRIKFSSYDADSFLGIPNECLTNKIINELIPPGISENHDEMIVNFLKNGKSKYLRQLQVNFLFYRYQQYMMEIDFAIETNLIKELNFIVFIQPTVNQFFSIILNLNLEIVCMSRAFIQELELQDSIKIYLGVKIKKIIPSFPQIILENHFVENAEIYLENQHLKNSSTSRGHFYYTNYLITSKKVNDIIAYYQVCFDYFKRNLTNQVSSQSDSINTSHHVIYDYIQDDQINDICNETPIKIPIEEDVKRSNPLFQEGLCSEQSHMINEFKFEQTNIKSTFRCNQTLLEQKFYTNMHQNPSKVTNHLISQKNESYLNEEQNKNHILDDAQSSQISSLQGLKKSEFYKKYDIFSKIKFQVGNSRYHRLFILTFTLSIISQVIIQSIQIAKININFQLLAADIDLLEIKNLIYQPFESFLLTRWTIFNYIQMQATEEITQQEYNYLVEFPRENLNLGYDQLDINLKQVLDRISISGFFQDQSLEIYIYVSTGEGEQFNFTLRNSIQILLNYLYEIKMRYQIEGTIVSDSPYVYYSYKNYLTMKQEFSILNDKILNNSISQSQQEQSQEELIFIIAIGIAFVQFCLTFNYFIQIQRLINKFYAIIFNMDVELTIEDIARLKFILGRLNKNQNALFRFQLNIDQREKEFLSKSLILNQKKKTIHKPYYFKQYFCYYLYFIFALFLIIGNALLTYEECGEYLSKYPETAKFFKSISDVGTDIPTMYAQRDILYNIEIIAPFFNDTEKAKILQEIKDSLNRTDNFLTLDFNLDNLIISKKFKEYYHQIQENDLCNFLPDYFSQKSVTICPQIMDQNMERGLFGLLIYICNFISNDMALNHFTQKLQSSYLELEGAFLVSYIIKDLNTYFHLDLESETQFYIYKINVHNVVILIFLFILILITITEINNKLIYKLYLAQRLPYLMPIKTIILNDGFERNLRQLIHN
ncbi:unnamed protein product [Paramecium sonneborni]|uniref:Transmembrane protein n=1 Tax=Paramecium sonneborni TaxID=65129 RepID=A0A8S1P319_9CILI|nr:unnamed protein product [Paramecium sonneborni]